MSADANELVRTDGLDALRRAFDRSERVGAEPVPRILVQQYRWRQPEDIPPRPWIYGQLLMRGTVSATVAPGGVGKTSLLIAEALAMATGRSLLTTPVHDGPKHVWILNLEEPEDELARRIQAACRHWSIPEGDIARRLFVNAGPGSALLTADSKKPGYVDESLFAELECAMMAARVDVLVLDPFVSSHALDENDNVQIDRVVKRWSRLAQRTRSAVHIVHHTRKADAAITSESARGAKALVDAARTVRILNPATPDDIGALGLQPDARAFYARRDKQNMAAGNDERAWFLVRSVSLENGPPADAVGVVIPIPSPKTGSSELDVATIQAIQAALDGKDRGYDLRASDWAGLDVAPILNLNPADKAHRRILDHTIGDLVRRGLLVRADAYDKRAGRNRPVVRVGKSPASPQSTDESVDECGTVVD